MRFVLQRSRFQTWVVVRLPGVLGLVKRLNYNSTGVDRNSLSSSKSDEHEGLHFAIKVVCPVAVTMFRSQKKKCVVRTALGTAPPRG